MEETHAPHTSPAHTLGKVVMWSLIIATIALPIGFLTIMLTRLIIRPRAFWIFPTFKQCFWVGLGVTWLLMSLNYVHALRENQDDYLKEIAAHPDTKVSHPDGAYDYIITDKNKITFITPPKPYKMKLRWSYYTWEYNQQQIVGYSTQLLTELPPDYPQPRLYLIGENDGVNRTFFISQAPDRVTDTNVTLKCYDSLKKNDEAYYYQTFNDYGGPDARMVGLYYIEGQRGKEDVFVTGEPVKHADGMIYKTHVDFTIMEIIFYVICIIHFLNAHYTAIRIQKELDEAEPKDTA